MDIIHSSLLLGYFTAYVYSSQCPSAGFYDNFHTFSLKLTVQPTIYQAKLLWIISALILSQNHHLHSELRKTNRLRRALLCAVPESLRVFFQKKLQDTLQMLVLKSQHFLPPITSVLIPETFTSINIMMPLKIECILIKFIPN